MKINESKADLFNLSDMCQSVVTEVTSVDSWPHNHCEIVIDILCQITSTDTCH